MDVSRNSWRSGRNVEISDQLLSAGYRRSYSDDQTLARMLVDFAGSHGHERAIHSTRTAASLSACMWATIS